MGEPRLVDSPCDVDVWYPILHGGRTCTPVTAAGRSLAGIRDSLEEGRSAAVHADSPGIRVARALAAGPVRRLGRLVPTGYAYDCFSAIPNTGGGFVLLPSGDPELFRAGLHLLPAGRLRWRLIRRLLDRAGAAGLSHLPGAAELGLLSPISADPTTPSSAALQGPLAGVASGVPGLHQKLIASLLASEAQPARIVKISKGTASRRQIEQEARALEHVNSGSDDRLAPQLLESGESAGRHYLVQERLFGVRSPDRFSPAHADYLLRLQRVDAPGNGMEWLASLERDRSYIAHRDPCPWRAAMAPLAESTELARRAAEIAPTYAHGDFTPWNLALHAGALRAFDWEYAGAAAPLNDLFHFVIQTGVLVEHLNPSAIMARIESLLEGPARVLMDAAGLDTHGARVCLGAYLLRVSVLAERQHEVERPDFVQVHWLRDARVALARKVVERLRYSIPSRRREVAA